MSQQRPTLGDARGPCIPPHLIQFYSIELFPTADGCFAVGIVATLCEREGELEGMDLGNHRVSSIDDALAVIRGAVAPTH